VSNKKRRIGKVRISNLFRSDAANMGHGVNLFIGAVVLSIDEDWISGWATYTMWHPQFEPLGQNEITPEYAAEFAPGEVAPTWKRVEHAGCKP
jgi:hypothetical protein